MINNFLSRIASLWQPSEWQSATLEEYKSAYAQFGGSFITHPEVLQALSAVAEMPLSYQKRELDGQLIGAVALWGKCLAGSKNGLKKAGKRSLIDIGNAEMILPLSQGHSFRLQHRGSNLSSLHLENISNLKTSDYQLAMAKPHQECSKKFRYNQRREARLLDEAGVTSRPIQECSAQYIAQTYTALFEKRWGFQAKGHGRIEQVIEKLKPFLIGYVLESEGQAIAIQLVFLAENPEWLSIEYLNGGVDPEWQKHSPGSVLTYLNTQWAEALAKEKGKTLRYSFGISDRGYKSRWCHPVPVGQL